MSIRDNVNIAIVLAGGKGARMNSDIPKQYIKIADKPILYYSLKVFQESFVDRIIIVAGESEIEYCRTEIAEAYGITKVTDIVAGGKERYHSVYNGLCAISDTSNAYIYIHDGARPCITPEILERCKAEVLQSKACVAAMPVKDTIKVVDANGYAVSTPDRNKLWQMQTPQVFSYEIVKNAYDRFIKNPTDQTITDDAMVVEQYGNTPVKMVKGSYENIKITTPEDVETVGNILKFY